MESFPTRLNRKEQLHYGGEVGFIAFAAVAMHLLNKLFSQNHLPVELPHALMTFGFLAFSVVVIALVETKMSRYAISGQDMETGKWWYVYVGKALWADIVLRWLAVLMLLFSPFWPFLQYTVTPIPLPLLYAVEIYYTLYVLCSLFVADVCYKALKLFIGHILSRI